MVWCGAHKRRLESVLAAVGLVAVMLLGAWWTGWAVVDGRPWVMLGRFAASVAGGVYYLFLLSLSRRQV